MSRALAIASVALAGCYATFRPGLSAPAGHGHGGIGFETGAAVGVEHFDDRLRAGGGVNLGPRLADENGYMPFAFDSHVVVAVGGRPYGDKWRPLIVLDASFGFAAGLPQFGPPSDRPDSPSGLFAHVFAGFGLGSLTTQQSYKIRAGHVALGLTATRFWTESADPFWMLGAALEMSFGWFQDR